MTLDTTRDSPSTAPAACDSPTYPGPWTACPQGEAVRRVIEQAGFEVFFDQGAAWHVTDHSTATFSVGVTKTPATRLRALPIVETLEGVPIRGYRGERLVWHAAGPAWWLDPQGAPPEDGRPVAWHLRLPSGEVLGRLVRASTSADVTDPS